MLTQLASVCLVPLVPHADSAPPAEEPPPAGPDGVAGEGEGGPLLDEDELAGHEEDGQLEETDEGERKEVGEETSDPEQAAAMVADAEKDPEANT